MMLAFQVLMKKYRVDLKELHFVDEDADRLTMELHEDVKRVVRVVQDMYEGRLVITSEKCSEPLLVCSDDG